MCDVLNLKCNVLVNCSLLADSIYLAPMIASKVPGSTDPYTEIEIKTIQKIQNMSRY